MLVADAYVGRGGSQRQAMARVLCRQHMHATTFPQNSDTALTNTTPRPHVSSA